MMKTNIAVLSLVLGGALLSSGCGSPGTEGGSLISPLRGPMSMDTSYPASALGAPEYTTPKK